MAVCAGCGIVGEVGISLGVDKGVRGEADGDAEEDGGEKADCDSALHERSLNQKRILSKIADAKLSGKDFCHREGEPACFADEMFPGP